MRIVSPIPSASSVPRPTADFSEPDHLVPASVIPRCSGIGDLLREQAVGGDRVGHGGGLHGDLEVVEVEALHQRDGLQGRGDERLDGVVVLELAQVAGQGAGVDADAQRRAPLAGERDDLRHLLGPADVAGVDAHAVGARLDRLQRERVVEVDVGDHRDRRLRDDALAAPRRPARGAPRRARCPPRPRRPSNLVHGGREVGGLGLGHRLHRDGSAAADRDASRRGSAAGRPWVNCTSAAEGARCGRRKRPTLLMAWLTIPPTSTPRRAARWRAWRLPTRPAPAGAATSASSSCGGSAAGGSRAGRGLRADRPASAGAGARRHRRGHRAVPGLPGPVHAGGRGRGPALRRRASSTWCTAAA